MSGGTPAAQRIKSTDRIQFTAEALLLISLSTVGKSMNPSIFPSQLLAKQRRQGYVAFICQTNQDKDNTTCQHVMSNKPYQSLYKQVALRCPELGKRKKKTCASVHIKELMILTIDVMDLKSSVGTVVITLGQSIRQPSKVTCYFLRYTAVNMCSRKNVWI